MIGGSVRSDRDGQGLPLSLIVRRIVQYAIAPSAARAKEVASRLARTFVSRGFPAKAEFRRTPAARLSGFISAIVAIGGGRYFSMVGAG